MSEAPKKVDLKLLGDNSKLKNVPVEGECVQSNAKLHWKERCLDLLKQAEKNRLSGHEGSSEIHDLIKKRDQEAEKLKIIQYKIKEMEKQLKDLDGENPSTTITSAELKLYQHITKLTFDLDSPPNELKGFVVGRPLKIFQLDTTKHSNEYIVNHLWQLIDPE